jgi:hypothetical protein
MFAPSGDVVVAALGLRPTSTIFSLEHGHDALRAVKDDALDGAAVIQVAPTTVHSASAIPSSG